MGSSDIAHEVQDAVEQFRAKDPEFLYLCDPVIGNTNCFVKPEVLEFFKTNLRADIITPNQFEAETLSGIKITDKDNLKKVAQYFHELGVKIVVITGVKLPTLSAQDLYVFIAYEQGYNLIKVKEYPFPIPPNGTGDLFSAVFLGTYLSTKNALESLRRTVYFTDQVMKNTFDAKSRELKIISVNYALFAPGDLPEVIAL